MRMNRRQVLGTAAAVLGGGVGISQLKGHDDRRKLKAMMQGVWVANEPRSFRFVSCSFSIAHAEWLSGTGDLPAKGPAWFQCLEEIVAHKKWASIRLSMPWSEVEAKPGEYSFDRFDRAIELCATSDIPVVLCLGIKNPRWPEVHIPGFYRDVYGLKLPQSLDSDYGQKLAGYLKACLGRYGRDNRVRAFQIENEPFEPTGPAPQEAVPLGVLRQEVKLARLHTDFPLWVTMGAGQTESFDQATKGRTPMAESLLAIDEVDSVGLNVYQKGQWRAGDRVGGFEAQPEHWGHTRSLAGWIEHKGKRPFISELQAEPWEVDPKTMDFRNPNGNLSFTPEQYVQAIHSAERLGCEEVFLWGVEFQIACKAHGNPVFWEMTEDLLNQGGLDLDVEPDTSSTT